jgi:hypothetical protein
MPYIGNTAGDRFVASKAASVYSGDGSTTAFTLEHAVGSDEDILVSVDGVIQEPSVAYAVSSGTTLTFTAAPSSNAGNNIFVYYLFRTVGTVDHPPTSSLQATDGTFSGVVDADAGITVDNITIDGTEIDLSSGDLTVDVAGDIILDADGGDIKLKDGSTIFGELTNNASADGNLDIKCPVSDADIRFKGVDGGANVTALRLDMSDAGTAVFNHDIKIADNNNIQLGAGADLMLSSDGTNGKIANLESNGDIIFEGNDGGSTITALTLDMSNGGAASFNDKIVTPSINTSSINTADSTGTLTMFGGGTNKGGTIELSGGNNTGSTGSGIVFKTGASTSSPSEKLRIDQYGHVTMPYQSAFSANLGSSSQTNIAVGSDVTVEFDTEIFDQNSDYNNSNYTFTAPVTGRYQFNIVYYLENIDTASGYYYIFFDTSNRNYFNIMSPAFTADIDYLSLTLSQLADMDAGDVAFCRIRQSHGTSQTDINANSYFSGYLVA